MKRYIQLLTALLLPVVLYAQHVRVTAPKQVAVGEEFQVEYTIFTDDVDNFRLPALPNGIERLYGPFTSRQSSFQMVNGHTSSSSSTTFTYVFAATRKGTFTLPPAKINVGGQTIASTPVRISASGNIHASNTAMGNSSPSVNVPTQKPRIRTNKVPDRELFITVNANKNKVYEQEGVLVTYKVYTAVNLVNLNGKMPDLTGFHVQEIKPNQQITFQTERHGGRNYRTATWSRYVMYPQVTGNLKIPSINFHAVVRQDIDDFDPFAFITDGQIEDIEKTVVAKGLNLQVLPLPNKPDDFAGAVGNFNITAQLDKYEVKAGDPINLRIVVSGNGNLKLIKQPQPQFPSSFDTYDAKVVDKTKLSEKGLTGSMVYDFLAVPRSEGEYEIPPVRFVYFDTTTNTYKTLITNAFKVSVLKGDGQGATISDIATTDSTLIKDIMKGDKHAACAKCFFGSTTYWGILATILIVFALLFYLLRKRAIMRSDLIFLKGKNAQKVATKKLYAAEQLMLKGRSSDFYDEVLRALWGYISNKFNMPVEELSRENISERLREKGVEDANIEMFIGAIDECEFERYAPGDEKGNMKLAFDKASQAITNIEETMTQKKSKHKGASFIFLVASTLLALSAHTAHAQHKEMADAQYGKGNYEQAARMYENILQHKKDATLYYNLGNAYYKNNNITKAIIAYERALNLSPSDPNIRFNLALAKTKTIDRLTPKPEMIFTTWYKAVANTFSIDLWSRLSLYCLALGLVAVLCYLFANKLTLRKIGFIAAIVFGIAFALTSLFAITQNNQLDNSDSAIIISPTLHIKKTPDSSAKDVTVLHEGTKLQIIDRTRSEWWEVETPSGQRGWISPEQVEKI